MNNDVGAGLVEDSRQGAPAHALAPVHNGQPQGIATTWYNDEDLRWAARRWATRIGVRLRAVQVRAMTTKWASMSTAGRLTLNSELLDLPRSTGEYVIVHELVHLLAPSHGKVFKSFMSAFMPDWEEREKGLG